MLPQRLHFTPALLLLCSLLVACATMPLAPVPPTATTTPPTSPPPTPTLPPPTSTPTFEPTPEPPPPVRPKTLTVCQEQEPESLYWYGNSRRTARHVFQALYDGPLEQRAYTYHPVILERLPTLGREDATLKKVIMQAGDRVVDAENNPVTLSEGMLVRPAGCYSPTCAVQFTGEPVEMEQLVVTFRLLEGVRWSDGTPVTAEDSVYSFALDADPATPTAKYTVNRTASYAARDAQTVVWTGLPGYMDPLYATNFWTPLPRHLWQETLGYTAAELLKAPESTRAPLGWGAFVVANWSPGKQIELHRNPYYFRAEEGLPAVERLIFRFVPDVNAALAQLLAGECDLITERADLEPLAPLLLRLQEQQLAVPVFTHDVRWEHVNFGINPAVATRRPDFFEDVRVRRAIAYCLNRQEVVKTLLYGQSLVPTSYLPPGHPLHVEDLPAYPYDPERGRALLEEAGWRDEDGNGIREAYGIPGIRDKTPLAFRWQTASVQPVPYLERFQNDLALCGIEVTISQLPVTEFFAMSADGPLFGRNFDLASFAWMTNLDPPPCELYMSTEIPSAANNWAGQNLPGFIDPLFDAACAQAQNALPGSADYIAGHQAAQRRFAEQLPALPLFLRLRLAAISPVVSGFAPDPTAASSLWNIESLDVLRP